jgi:hypothetical protein
MRRDSSLQERGGLMVEVRRQSSLGDFLVREGIISQSQFNKALEVQGETLRSIGRILVEMGLISENMRMTVLRKQFGFEVAVLKDVTVKPEVLQEIPYSFAEKHRVVPLRIEKNGTLVVAMEDPSDLLVTDAIKNQIGMNVKAFVASCDDVQQVLDQYQTGSEDQPILTSPKRVERTWLQTFLHTAGFWILAIIPLMLFFLAIRFDWWDVQHMLNEQNRMGNLSPWDLALYIALIWGLWAVILFEINGLLFDQKPENEL